MGCTSSTEEEKRNRQINRSINQDLRCEQRKMSKTVKLLLLGTGESGKSTIAKQMKIIHLKGFTQDELISYRPIIHCNTLESIQVLINGAKTFGYQLTQENQPIAAAFSGKNPLNTEFNTLQATQIKKLWADEAIQKAWQRRNELQVPDVANFLFENLDRISTPNYIPDQSDCLRCRARTTGIIETRFEINNFEFRIVDVGGQRAERKKWISCFQEVMALLFCVALSEYDQVLFEDQKTNRMHESLELFSSMANSKWFISTSKILFLNKSDIFQDKILHKDLKCCFPDYQGGCDFLNATQYIEKVFTERNKTKTPIYTHITCATNTENIAFVFNTVKDIILNKSLAMSGFGDGSLSF